MKLNLKQLGVSSINNTPEKITQQIIVQPLQMQQPIVQQLVTQKPIIQQPVVQQLFTETQVVQQHVSQEKKTRLNEHKESLSDLKIELENYKNLLASKESEIKNLLAENQRLQETLQKNNVKEIVLNNSVELKLQHALKEVENLKEKNTELKADKEFLQNLFKDKSTKSSYSLKSKDSSHEENIKNYSKKLEFSDIVDKEQTVVSESFNNSVDNLNSIFSDIKKTDKKSDLELITNKEIEISNQINKHVEQINVASIIIEESNIIGNILDSDYIQLN